MGGQPGHLREVLRQHAALQRDGHLVLALEVHRLLQRHARRLGQLHQDSLVLVVEVQRPARLVHPPRSDSWIRPRLLPSRRVRGAASQPRIGGCSGACSPKPRQRSCRCSSACVRRNGVLASQTSA
jgi:hypothetical protein